MPDIEWHGTRLREPGWDDPSARLLAYTLAGLDAAEDDLHVILNMSDVSQEFAIPVIAGRTWHVAIDTSSAEPDDIFEPASQPLFESPSYRVGPRSIVVLEARER